MIILVLVLLVPLAVVLLCVFASKSNKLKKFIDNLYKSGRISDWEYNNSCVYYGDDPTKKSNTSSRVSNSNYTPPYSPNSPNPKTAANNPAYVKPVEQSVYNNYQNNYPYTASASNANKKKTSPFGIILGVGIAFIFLAGIIFSFAVWADMQNWQKTGIISLFMFAFFAVGILFSKKAKIDYAGNAFYILGSLFSVIVFFLCANYSFLGEFIKNSTFMKSGLCFFTFAIFSGIGYFLFKKNFYLNLVLYSVAISEFFLFRAISNYDVTMFVSIFTAAVAMLAVKLTEKLYINKKSQIRETVKIFCIIYSIATTIFGVVFIISTWNILCHLTSAIFLAECVIYGVILKKKAFLHLLSACTVFILCNTLLIHGIRIFDNDTNIFICGLLLFVFGLIFTSIKKIRTLTSDIIFPWISFIANISLWFSTSTEAYVFATIEAFLLLLLLIYIAYLGENRNKSLSTVLKYSLFVPILMMFTSLEEVLDRAIFERTIQTYTVLLPLAALIISFIPIIAKKTIDKDQVYSEYMAERKSYIILSSLTLGFLVISKDMNDFPYYISYIAVLIVIMGIYLNTSRLKNNLWSAIPLFLFISTLYKFIYHITSIEFMTDISDYITAAFHLVLALVLCVISRILFKDNLCYRDRNKKIFKLDIYEFAILIPFFEALFVGILNKWSVFVGFIIAALFWVNLYRKNNKKVFNYISLSFMMFSVVLAIIFRPFAEFDSLIAENRLTCLMFVLLGVGLKILWNRFNKTAAEILQFIISIYVVLDFIIVTLITGKLIEFILTILFAMIILAYAVMIKRKKWLALSLTILVLITVYSIKDFLLSIGWWLWLLIIGIVLVTVALTHELKKKNPGRKKIFYDWKW